MTEEQAKRLTLTDNSTIAYHHSPGKSPGVVFLTGFKSDMTGGKALALEAFCQARGQAFLRFDYTGHGESSGEFIDGTIGRWASDAVAAIDNLIEGPVVLIGSSMGGWLMLLAALQRKERIAGLLGIAAAPDFTEELLWKAFSDEQRKELETTGKVLIPNCYEDLDDYDIAMELITEGRNHLLLGNTIDLTCPVRLIHGMKDEDVPWETSLQIQEKLTSTDVEVTLVKEGDHRLSSDADLDRLTLTLDRLLGQLAQS